MPEYIKVNFSGGMTIEEAVEYLHQLSNKTGKDYYGTFNNNTLTSDMTVDEAYIKYMGMTLDELRRKQEEWRQDLIKREEEHQKRIPQLTKEYIEKGHKILSKDKWDEWDRCVPIRLGDLYEGMELGQCLDIIKTVKDNSIVAGIEVMKNQCHSGMSWGLMKSMIKTFCDCGNEFVETLDNM